MVRKEIFNKYKLNDCIYSYAVKQLNDLWSDILSLISPSASQTDAAVLRTIIEGAFEKSAEYSVPSELIVKKLVALL